MPEETDWEVYTPKVGRTPEQDGDRNMFTLILAAYAQVVDRPVTAWKEWMDRQRAKNRLYYYHQNFRRVPDITECVEEDVGCIYEAEMQWKRDQVVDQHILNIIQERVGHCKVQEGDNHIENCQGVVQQLKDVTKAYWNKYGDLGAFGTARKCLMKQKEMMIAERKARKAAEEAAAAAAEE